jgi:hypothetical protein
VTFVDPESYVICPPLKFACAGVIVQPTPPQLVVLELWQLLERIAEKIALSGELPATVTVKLAEPLGLVMLTTGLAVKF